MISKAFEESETSLNTKKLFYEIDSLKFIMIFAIVFFHYYVDLYECGNISQLPFFRSVFKYGDHAVEFFFIVSGFLIAARYRDLIGKMTLIEFMGRRLKSLLPPVILAELLMGLLLPIMKAVIGQPFIIPNFYEWFQSLTLSAKGYIGAKENPIAIVTWYCNILALCYLLYWSVGHISRHNYKRYVPLCGVLVFFGYVCIYFFDAPLLWHVNGRGYCCFFCGTLLYELQTYADRGDCTLIDCLMFAWQLHPF